MNKKVFKKLLSQLKSVKDGQMRTSLVQNQFLKNPGTNCMVVLWLFNEIDSEENLQALISEIPGSIGDEDDDDTGNLQITMNG